MSGVAVSPPAVSAVPMTEPAVGTDANADTRAIGPDPSLPAGISVGCGAPVTTVPDTSADAASPPSGAQAEAKARAILSAAGYDLSGWSVTSVVSSDVTQVTAAPGLDGAALDQADGGSATVGVSLYFGPGAEVSSGSGSWGQPVEADAYPLIGTSAGIDALNRGRDLPGVEPMMAAPGDSSAGSVAPDTTEAATTPNLPAGPAPTPACPAIGGSGPPDAVGPCRTTTTIAAPPSTVNCGALAGRVPSCPPPDPRSTTTTVTAPPTVTAPVTATMAPRQVRIDRSELVLEPMAGTDGATWLVPAYRFGSSTTPGTWTVLAIDRKWFDPGAQSGSGTTDTTDPFGTSGAGSGGASGSSPGSPPTTIVSTPVTPEVPPRGPAVPASSTRSGPTG